MDRSRILLADDDPVLLAVGSESLIAERYDVTTAEDGDAVLAILQHERFDVIVLDIEMPSMSGLTALQHIRASENEAIASVPVIMLTGRNDDEAIGRCYDLGATSYVAKPVNWLNMLHQIAFVQRAEENTEALRAAHDAALERSRAKDIAMMTLRHELRSPLHVIQGFSTLLSGSLGEKLTGEDKTALTMIEGAVGSMTDKINRLFLYAEILNGDFALMPDFTTARRVVNKAVETVQTLADEKHITIDVIAPDGVPVEMKADDEKLAICVAELLSNAIVHGPEDSTVMIHTTQRSEDGAVSIVIEDEGDGFTGDSNELFKPFMQGDGGLTRSSAGLGLGLTVAKSIAKHHGGRVELLNRDVAGARAMLIIPSGLAAARDAA